MPFIGQQPLTGAYSKLDSITTSATATYNLQLDSAAYSPASANHLLVSLNGVMQAPVDSFTVSGSTITFASALTSSDNIDFIMALGDVLNIGTPSDGTVTTAKIATNAVTDAKITGMSSSKLTGALPAISGAALTGISGGKVLQVVMGTTATASSTGGSTYVDTGLSATITPSATTSKVLAMVNQPLSISATTNAARDGGFRLVRGSTDLIQGMAEIDHWDGNGNFMKMPAYNALLYLDSPSTTSATTYKTTFRVNAGSSDIYAQQHGATSSIILMEIAG
jgi:hypothetical protein